jgi:preprotein translocase subunit YajC
VNSPGFLILIVAFGFLWFVLIRPQKRRQVEAARLLNSLNVGDEVLTAGGIYGEITALEEDAVLVRIAPELEVRVARKAIGAVVKPEETPEPVEPVEPHDDPDASPKPDNDG